MTRNTHASLFILTAVLAALLSACAPSPTKLRPDQVKSNEGTFFGHIQVLNRDAEVTSDCYAEFTDSKGDRKAYTSLDKSGWVYSVVSRGETYLSHVWCPMGMFSRIVEFKTREFKYQVPGDGKLAYFGHVTVQLDYDSSRFTTCMALGSALAGPIGVGVVYAIAGTSVEAAKQVTVEDRFNDALAEYRARYGDASGRLQAVNAAMPWQNRKACYAARAVSPDARKWRNQGEAQMPVVSPAVRRRVE